MSTWQGRVKKVAKKQVKRDWEKTTPNLDLNPSSASYSRWDVGQVM